MKVKNRGFNKRSDIRTLQNFLSDMRNNVSNDGYFHLGDLQYRMNLSSNNFIFDKDIRIWEEADKIIGFVLFLTVDSNPEFQLKPEFYNTNIAKEMVNWTIQRSRELKFKKIEVSCLRADTLKKDFLLNHGFKKFDDPFVCMGRTLEDIPEYNLPSGYSIVNSSERPDLPGILDSSMSVDEYKKMCSSVGYKADLGNRVCFNNEIVAGCICWYDDIGKCGLFEPVGTIDAHQRKGLAFSVMAKTMENLKEYGVNKVHVHTSSDNYSAIKLYQKLGFEITNYDDGYELDIAL